MIKSLLAAKEATGKSFTHIGQELGLTNTFAAQLFYNQVWAIFCQHSRMALHRCCMLLQQPLHSPTSAVL